MRSRGVVGTWSARAWVVLLTALMAVGGIAARAQNAPPPAKAKAKAKAAPGQRGRGPLKKALPEAADPLANQPEVKAAPVGSYHFRFKLRSLDGTMLNATYYLARQGTTAPVVLMVHEKDRSSKDFEEPIGDLKGQGIAEHMQGLNYAVLTVDLRGQGANVRKTLTPQDWRAMVEDLQAAYLFLLDRNNRGELNLSRLGVLALGEGANLAAAWAHTPGGGVSHEGRTSDIGALVLLSPMSDGEGYPLGQVLAALAPRVPMMLMAGEDDPASGDPVRAARPIVERGRLNKVEFAPSKLHGWRLLRLEPKLTAKVFRFFESTIKYKTNEWEPRYNLNPVAFSDIVVVRNAKPPAPAVEPPAEKKEAEPKGKEKEKEKDKKAVAAPK